MFTPEVCTVRQFSEATGMSEDSIRRKCESGELAHSEKVGGRWFINYDRTMGKAAPARVQPVDVEQLSEQVASKLWQAFATGFAGPLPTTRFYPKQPPVC